MAGSWRDADLGRLDNKKRQGDILGLFDAYIPWDRVQAIGRGEKLPHRTWGAALFADISGFTPLTEALTRTMGPRRGAEELTLHLNRVYQALVTEVHRFGGSVIGFAGDAITCWFDQDDGLHAVASALSMQRAMAQIARVTVEEGVVVALAVKASVSTGPARRFLVGDEELQLIDVIAGETLNRMAAAGGVALKGELVLDRETAVRLRESLEIKEWRADRPGDEESFAIVTALQRPVDERPHGDLPPLSENQVRPWVLSPVYSRLVSGQGEFLTELRPAVPIFLKFDGIDYDGDDGAGEKLDAFVKWVQRLLASFGGFLIGMAVGDKGSYLFNAFGAPIAHENDLWRALTAASQLRRPPPELAFISSVQIGISRGLARTGAYGGAERRTYGVLGSEVNMAARLMEKAEPGHVLATGWLQSESGDAFTWEPKPPIQVKGKEKPLPVAVLLEPTRSSPTRLRETSASLPLVGRVQELASIKERLQQALAGRGQSVVLVAEAGMGKSRLAAEVVTLSRKSGFIGNEGHCVSHGSQTSYLAWWSIWSEFFRIDASRTAAEQIASVERQLAEIDRSLVTRLPLLGPVLNLPIHDNEITADFDAKLRKSSLEALLADCVRHRASTERLLFIIEDAHWMDPLSKDLLEVIGRAVMRLPVFILVTQRPPEESVTEGVILKSLPNTLVVRLEYLSPIEAEQLLKQKMAHIFGPEVNPSRELLDLLIERSGGNPFYLEELLNFLKDQGGSPGDPLAATSLELPTSLHSLILSRIDQLTERQKTTVKLASVVGRVFSIRTLVGVNSAFREDELVNDLNELGRLQLTPIDRPWPESTYMFNHAVTQEVAYQCLPSETRTKWHNDIGLHLEATATESEGDQVDLLAFHFDRSQNEDKKRHYLLKAGESAKARYANAAAIDYYRKVLPLLPVNERVKEMLQLGQVQELTGKWVEAGQTYDAALRLALEMTDVQMEARCRSAIGELRRKEGEYVEALKWLEEARCLHEKRGDETGLADVLHLSGTVNAQRGEFERAVGLYEQSMTIRRKQLDKRKIASLLSNLGIIEWYRADLNKARDLYEESLAIRREIGERWSIANSLNNLALLMGDLGEFATARNLLEECLAINRELGDRWSISNSLSSLADVTLDQGDYSAVRGFLVEGMTISRELGDRITISFLLEQFAQLAVGEADAHSAFTFAGAAASLREILQSAAPPNQQTRLTLILA